VTVHLGDEIAHLTPTDALAFAHALGMSSFNARNDEALFTTVRSRLSDGGVIQENGERIDVVAARLVEEVRARREETED
jgi:hypothetical protein